MLPRLDGSDPMAFCLVGRQLPTDELALLLPLARIEPLAAFGAAIHPASVRNPVLLITPVVHDPFPKRRETINQPLADRNMGRYLAPCSIPHGCNQPQISVDGQYQIGERKAPQKLGLRTECAGVKRMRILTILFSQFFPSFYRKGFDVGLPARAPADMPFPNAAQKGSGIPVIARPEAAFLTIAHPTTSTPPPLLEAGSEEFSMGSQITLQELH
jgi:hypothetical protein